jgi:hypothetical protein
MQSPVQASCPNCGKPLPAQVLAGLCPACLLLQGAESVTDAGPDLRPFKAPSIEALAALFPQLEIQSLLGAGGMGAVYKARQPALDRLVALKILPGGPGAEPGFAERFNREARALARLNHPNIVAVHEFGQAGDLHYFIMEYVDGVNLRQLEKSKRISPREALQLVPQICDALQYAHDEGVVHRDIKPENVLVDRRGRVKIADFGLAKIVAADAEKLRLTLEGQVMGTPHYMAPEQIERPLDVDHRADIYSLGVVLYEMLTGELPLGKFDAPSRKVQLDVRLDEVVLRALENDPERRYQHASEVKSKVQTIAEAPPKATAPMPPKAAPAAPIASAPRGRQYHTWAGFPVVSEYDGEREINWNGTLAAIATSMATVAVGFLIVHWITGEGNIPGAFQVCLLVTLGTVLSRVRKVLHATEDRVPRTGRERLVFLALPLFVIGWSLFQLHWLNPRLRAWANRTAVAQVAEPNEAGILVAQLPGGGTVELLAVSHLDGAPNQWWRPDGRPVESQDFELHQLDRATPGAGFQRKMVMRVANLSNGASGPYLEADRDVIVSSSSALFSGGRPLPGGRGLLAEWPKSPGTATLRAGIGLEPPRTVVRYLPRERQTVSVPRAGDPRWQVEFHEPTEGKDGAHLTVVLPPRDRNWEFSMMAVDEAGREQPHHLGSGSVTPRGRDSVWSYTFPGLPLGSVKEFQVRVQPVHWVEFRGIAVEPKAALPPARPLLLGPETTMLLASGYDLDTASAEATPEARDLAIQEGMVKVNGAEFAPFDPARWDTATARDAIDAVYRGRFAPPSLMNVPGPEDEVFSFAYQTRDGGFGLLQLARRAGGNVELRHKPLRR